MIFYLLFNCIFKNSALSCFILHMIIDQMELFAHLFSYLHMCNIKKNQNYNHFHDANPSSTVTIEISVQYIFSHISRMGLDA